MTKDTAPPKRFAKGDFYRLMREWHGYLSAFAFLALIFFAGTGILLNHPGLLQGEPPAAVDMAFTLSAAEIAELSSASSPGEVLEELAAKMTPLVGAISSVDVAGRDIYVNMQGVRGTATLAANLDSGAASIHVERDSAVKVMNELHRGERASPMWRLFLDIIAGVLIVMSVLGYGIFLSLRFRLTTALVLTGASLAAMIGLFVFATT
ncbi:MAG: hypothetical protein EON93_04240 [Burkholderiales bacterium]|nr:MAG: hypothetical protein EON93_04240 [Burkholderiales bacterium]